MTVQTESRPYRQTHDRTDGLSTVQMDGLRIIQDQTDGLGIVRRDSGLYGWTCDRTKRTRDRTKGLRIVWTDSGLYGWTRGRTNGFVIVDRIGISQTDSESYRRTQDFRDGHNI